MAYEATDLTQLLVQLIWACLSTGSWINRRFLLVLPSQDKLAEIFSTLKFTFCDGLFSVLQAADPPPLSWFESLPFGAPKNVWGIYVLVLKKRGYPPLLYLGSGTSTRRGLRSRLASHLARHACPHYVLEALKAGYTITHTATLVHIPIPAAADVPWVRTVIIALEAALSCVFWTMRHRDKDYGFSSVCPWSRMLHEWDGLCTHNPLKEPVLGLSPSLSAEELEAIAAAVQKKNQAYQEVYQKALRANPTPEFRARMKRHNKRQRASTKARQQAAIKNQDYYCPFCKVACRDAASLRVHQTKPRHKRIEEYGPGPYSCSICDGVPPFKY
jgi:hypothetical protein